MIEILIVVAIIGILASVVLVGLGPAQRKGRDARRISDLRNVQTGLELYFSKCGFYPGDPESGTSCIGRTDGTGGVPFGDWSILKTALTGSSIGVNSIPSDPGPAGYQYSSDGNGYVLAATLDDPSNPALNDDVDGSVFGVDCGSFISTTEETAYCIQF